MSQATGTVGRRTQPWAPFLLGLLVLLGFSLRFYRIDAKTVWLDEAFSIWLAHQPLVEMWAWLTQIDQHPPLYYSLLHYWIRLFGDAQGAVRALSALCSGAAIPFFYGACRYLVRQRTALLATLLLALSPFQIRYAQETRMYALLTLTVALALYLLMVVLFDAKARQRQWPWVGLALAQAAVMLTHNTATVFFPLALNSAVGGALLWKRWSGHLSSLPALNTVDFQRRWLRTQLLAVVAWSPWSISFILQALMVEREFWIEPPTLGLLYETLHNFNFAFLPAWSLPMMMVNGGWWLLAAFGVRSLRQSPALASLLLVLLLLPIGGELAVSLRRPIFADRTLIWVMLPYFILVAAGIEELGRVVMRGVRRINSAPDSPNPLERVAMKVNAVIVGGMVLLSALHGLALHNYYRYFEKEEWAVAAAYVAEQVEPGELILFNATWVQLPFQYYFRHYDQTAELRGVPVDLFDRGVLEPKMSEADLPYLHNLLAGRESVWLIYSHDWYTDPQGILPRELQQQMVLVEQRAFVGLQVMHFRRTP